MFILAQFSVLLPGGCILCLAKFHTNTVASGLSLEIFVAYFGAAHEKGFAWDAVDLKVV